MNKTHTQNLTNYGEFGLSNHINIASQYGTVDTTCDESPMQMTYKILVEKLVSDHYTQLNQWYKKDSRFKVLTQDIGITWPSDKKYIGEFVKTEKQSKQFILGLGRLYTVTDDPYVADKYQEKINKEKKMAKEKLLIREERDRELETQYLIEEFRQKERLRTEEHKKEKKALKEQTIAECDQKFEDEREMYEARISRLEQDLRETRTQLKEVKKENQKLIEEKELAEQVVEKKEQHQQLNLMANSDVELKAAETQRYTNSRLEVKPKKMSSSPSPAKRALQKSIAVESRYDKPVVKPYKPFGTVTDDLKAERKSFTRKSIKEQKTTKVVDYRGAHHPTNTFQMSARDATIEMYAKRGVTVEQLKKQGYEIDETGALKPCKAEKKVVVAGQASGFYSPVHKKSSLRKKSILSTIA